MKQRFTENTWRNDPWFKSLASLLLSCKTHEQMADALRDVGTLSELQAWSERLEVAKQLSRGLSYRQVAANTGASTTTVTRVAKFVEDGEGGYRKYLNANKRDIQEESSAQTGTLLDASVQKGIQKAGVLQKYLNK